MNVSYKFDEVKQRKEATVKCPVCNKKRKKVVSKSYYNNGLHNAAETSIKNWEWVNAKVEQLESEGLICAKCHRIQLIARAKNIFSEWRTADYNEAKEFLDLELLDKAYPKKHTTVGEDGRIINHFGPTYYKVKEGLL